MGKAKDLTGEKFGKLTAIESTGRRNSYGVLIWKCQCDCGNVKEVASKSLMRGITCSCGCLYRESYERRILSERIGETRIMNNGLSAKIIDYRNCDNIDVEYEDGTILYNRRYGHFSSGNIRHPVTKYKTRLYMIWCDMKQRCCNPNDASYIDYGGRGIIVCDNWVSGFESFRNWAMENGYSDDLTIDRIDVNGNYEPLNCRWATPSQQMQNTRMRKDNKSGVVGVSWDKKARKWHVQISANRKNRNIGYYESLNDAMAARKAAEVKYWGNSQSG